MALTLTLLLAVAAVAAAMVALSVGIILGRSRPLKEPCHGRSRNEHGHPCSSCTCILDDE